MARNQSQITTLDDDEPVAVAQPQAEVKGKNFDATLSGKKVALTIHPSDGDGGSDAVFLQLNGYAYQVPRGKPQVVPVELVEILENAKQTILSFGAGGVVNERAAPRFAFSATAV